MFQSVLALEYLSISRAQDDDMIAECFTSRDVMWVESSCHYGNASLMQNESLGGPLDKTNLAVLVGNGLSIAFNPELTLASITKELVLRLEKASDNGDKLVHAMNEIARRALPEGDVTDEDFEKLVGAFDSQARTLEELGKLAQLVDEDDHRLQTAIREVSSFSERLNQLGLSYVLQIITERSQGNHEAHGSIHKFLVSMIEKFDGTIHIGNLNYDTLLLSALMAVRAPMCDMAKGYGAQQLSIIDLDQKDSPVIASYMAYPLRTEMDYPPTSTRRVRLLHLHGSVIFWQNVEGERHVKVPVESLRQYDMWTFLGQGRPTWKPSVVLASARDKGYHVKKKPYVLGYQSFVAGLKDSDHWLIIGYSFRDACVNDELRKEFLTRKVKPKVFVSTYGEMLTREEIERALGSGAEDSSNSDWLIINREGVIGLESTREWMEFTVRPDPLWDWS